MRRPLVVGSRGDRLQAIESLRARVVVKTSARIVAPLDRPQANKLLSCYREASGIETSSRFAIRSSSGCATLIIEILSEYIRIVSTPTLIPSEYLVDYL